MKENKKIISLENLRILALLGVLIFHMFPHILPGGFLGVVVFFVLAGHLYTRKIVKIYKEDGYVDVGGLLKTRIFKLFPPVVFVVSLVLLTSYFICRPVFNFAIHSSISSMFGFDNIRQILSKMSYFDRHGNFNPFTHLWALSLEMQFYILYPFFLHWALKKTCYRDFFPEFILWIATIVSIASMTIMAVLGVDATRMYYGTDTRLYSFTLGALSYFFLNYENSIVKRLENLSTLQIVKVILYILVILPFFKVNGESRYVYLYFMTIYTFLVCALVVISSRVEILQSQRGILANTDGIFYKIVSYLGKRSYYIYLWQFAVSDIVRVKLSNTRISIGLSSVLQIFIFMFLSEVTYHLMRAFKNKKLLLSVFVIIFILVDIGLIGFNYKNSSVNLTGMKSKIERNQKKLEEENSQIKVYKPETILDIANQEQLVINREKKKRIIEARMKRRKEKIEKDLPNGILDQEDLALLKNLSVTTIGDSVALSCTDELKKLMPNMYINAKVSRSFVNGMTVLSNIKAETGLGDVVVICLGTNGDFNTSYLDKLKELTAGKKVVIVNCVMPDPWEDSVNKKLEKYAKDNNAVLVDWYGYAKDKPDIFYPDKTHPNPKGSKKYAELIAGNIVKLQLTENK